MTDAGPAGGRVVILGVAESDAHAVANRLIALHLRAHRFQVLNLGVCTPLADFAEAYTEHPEAEAVLIGSLNGHVLEDLRELPALRAAGRLACPVIVGGNPPVGRGGRSTGRRLRALGVDHVVDEVHDLVPLLDLLVASRVPRGAGT